MGLPGRKTDSSVTRIHKSIQLRPQKLDIAEAIAAEAGISPISARVLAARGYTVGTELERFITPNLRTGMPNPKSLKNVDAAARLIGDTVRRSEGITICCDFDVDGLSGGAQLFHALKSVGARVQALVPDRFSEGYGLNERMVRKAALDQHKLLITVDYGTTNVKELTLARELGLQTIVVDHHHVEGELPPVDVFVNPQQPGCGFADGLLCAAGLVWFLLVALRDELESVGGIDPKSYLDLACLGTICDMVPLIGVNRIIARRGLELLTQTKRPGLIALKQAMGIHDRDVECSHISFGIGPRMNAAGRMVHGDAVLELLTTSDSQKAEKIAQRLNRLNTDRQEEEERVKSRAVRMVQERGVVPMGMVVWNEHFHTGVIGLVAQRLVEMFYRPAAVMGGDETGILKGSVRGIKGFHVAEALAAVGGTLIKHGGHAGAGGFSVQPKRAEEFALAFEAECEKRLKDVPLQPVVEADTEVEVRQVTPGLVAELQRFAPFGIGNPSPQLLIRNIEVVDVRSIKNTHLKVVFLDGRTRLSGMFWRVPAHPAIERGAKVDIVCKPDMNTYQGVEEVYANLQAVQLAER